MAFQMTVPLVQQDSPKTCWYAAACMVAYYRKPGPRLGLPQVFAQGQTVGLRRSQFDDLAKAEGLMKVPNAGRQWTVNELEDALKLYGPLWCAGKWQGVMHVIVVTGIGPFSRDNSLSVLKLNDPAYPVPKEGTIKWFNDNLSRETSSCMLYMPRV